MFSVLTWNNLNSALRLKYFELVFKKRSLSYSLLHLILNMSIQQRHVLLAQYFVKRVI